MILQHNLVFESKRFKNKWYKGVWVELQGSLVIIKEGAFSDGATWCWDGREKDAWFVHDNLRCDKKVPLTVNQKDLIMYDILKSHNFKLFGWLPFSPEIVYLGVVIGRIHYFLKGDL